MSQDGSPWDATGTLSAERHSQAARRGEPGGRSPVVRARSSRARLCRGCRAVPLGGGARNMLTKCTRCTKVFNRVGEEELCPECESKAAAYARRIEDFLRFHDTRDVAQVVVATGVPRGFVLSFMKGQDHAAAIQAGGARPRLCVRCNAVATVGAHCQRCAIDVRQQVHTVAAEAQEETPPPRASIATDRRSRTTGGQSHGHAG